MPVYTLLLSTFILYIIMIDIFLLFHRKKWYKSMRRPSVIVVSHTPNQLIKHQGFLRRASEVHFEQTLSFIEIIFSYSTCGAKWCQRHVWVWQTIFWSRAKNCQRKTDNIIGMSKITTNIAIIRQIHKCTSEWQCFDETII